MKAFIYTVRVIGQESQVGNVSDVVELVNTAFNCNLLTTNMVYNYFNRPHVANKRIFGLNALVQLERSKPSTSSQPE